MKELKISNELLRHCFAHGAQGYPEEVCGILAGPEDKPHLVTAAHPLANILNQKHAEDPEGFPRTAAEGYVLDPREHMLLERKLGKSGEAVRVIYHSHVDVGAYFSDEDKRRALWNDEPLYPGVAYLVCGVKNRKPDGAVLVWYDPSNRLFSETRIVPPGQGAGE
jgi:proteasome lid subunit RPN8/RPN11